MNVTVKSIKSLTKGTNKYGPWELWKITTTQDVEWTTLAKEAGTITAGMVIKLDELSIDEKDGKEQRSFKKFEIVEQAITPSSAPGHLPKSDNMSKEEWRDKDRAKQDSIETQVIWNGIAQMQSSEHFELPKELIPKYHALLGAALDWAMEHFKADKTPQVKAQKPTPEATTTKPEPPKEKSGSPLFKNTGGWLSEAHIRYPHMTKDQFFKKVPELKLDSTPEEMETAMKLLIERMAVDETQDATAERTEDEKLWDNV